MKWDIFDEIQLIDIQICYQKPTGFSSSTPLLQQKLLGFFPLQGWTGRDGIPSSHLKNQRNLWYEQIKPSLMQKEKLKDNTLYLYM